MFALARELVVTTTTTKILESEPSLHGSPLLILEKEEVRLIKLLQQSLGRDRHVSVASEELPTLGKLRGIKPELVDKLAKLGQISYIEVIFPLGYLLRQFARCSNGRILTKIRLLVKLSV